MIKEFIVYEDINQSGLAFVDVHSRDGIGFDWLDGFSSDMKDKFGYSVVNKCDGVDEAIWDFENDEKQIMVIYDQLLGIEIHPQHKQAEEDVKKMGVYLKEFLENLSD